MNTQFGHSYKAKCKLLTNSFKKTFYTPNNNCAHQPINKVT